jgi:hypothetical protein
MHPCFKSKQVQLSVFQCELLVCLTVHPSYMPIYIIITLQEVSSSIFIYSSISSNITLIYSSALKSRKVQVTDVHKPVCSSVNRRIYVSVYSLVNWWTYRAQPTKVGFHTRCPKSPHAPNSVVAHTTSEFLTAAATTTPIFAAASAQRCPLPPSFAWSIYRPTTSTCHGRHTGMSPTAAQPPQPASAQLGATPGRLRPSRHRRRQPTPRWCPDLADCLATMKVYFWLEFEWMWMKFDLNLSEFDYGRLNLTMLD